MTARSVPPPHSRKSGSSTSGIDKSFTRLLAVETVPDTGLDMDLRATESECAAVAEACGVVAVEDFEANFNLRKLSRERVKVTGRLRARVTQTCVVSLEPFESLVDADIEVDFAPLDPASGQAVSQAGAALHGGGEPPDPIVDGKIDLGPLAVEFLILNLDIHPRRNGVAFEGPDFFGEGSEEKSPFAVLRHRS